MLDLAGKAWALEGIHEYPRGQLCWEVPRLISPSEQIALWQDNGGELIGFALFYPGLGHGHVVHDESKDAAKVEQQILEWSEARCATCPRGAMIPDAIASEQQTGRVRLLLRNGYARVEGDYMPVMRRSLHNNPVQVPAPPTGYTVRSMRDERDLAQRVAVQRAAFGAKSVTNESNYAAVMRTPDYRHDLDVAVKAEGGTFVAFCLAWYDSDNGIGMFEPVGTDPGYRRMGLARIAVSEALRRLQMLGATTAQVCHDLDNVSARHLYESVGFSEVDRLYRYCK